MSGTRSGSAGVVDASPHGASPAGISPLSPDQLPLRSLLERMTSDLSTLLRQEVALAKVELKEEATKAARGGGMLGGAALAGWMALLLLSFAAAWALAEVIAPGAAFAVVGALYALAAGLLAVGGRRRLGTLHGPEQTIETLKEDARWAREQMS